MGIKWLSAPSKNATGSEYGWHFGQVDDGLIVVDRFALSRY